MIGLVILFFILRSFGSIQFRPLKCQALPHVKCQNSGRPYYKSPSKIQLVGNNVTFPMIKIRREDRRSGIPVHLGGTEVHSPKLSPEMPRIMRNSTESICHTGTERNWCGDWEFSVMSPGLKEESVSAVTNVKKYKKKTIGRNPRVSGDGIGLP